MTSTYEKNLSQMQQKMLLEQRRIKLRRLGRNRVAVIGTLIVLVMAVIAIAAPLIATHDPYAFVVADRLMPPSAQHLFGTDSMGQDVFSRVIYGTRTSMVVGLCVSLSAGFIGTLLGLYASANKVLDHILMRLCDGLKAIPSILFAICLMTMLGPDIKNVILAWPSPAFPIWRGSPAPRRWWCGSRPMWRPCGPRAPARHGSCGSTSRPTSSLPSLCR